MKNTDYINCYNIFEINYRNCEYFLIYKRKRDNKSIKGIKNKTKNNPKQYTKKKLKHSLT